MRQPSAASFMPYKNIPNFPGLKGGASNYATTQQSAVAAAAMFMPPSMPIQTLTPNTPQQHLFTPTPTTPQTTLVLTPTTTPTSQNPKRRAPSPEIIVDDRPSLQIQKQIPEKKTKSDKILPELK
uniref:Uncharacterized protein n=1 Tax=Panagrolaimus superbus TaxID=310955 RepID=A0A914Z9T0_9BILA